MVKNIFSRVFVLLIYLLQSDHTGYSGMQNIEGQDWWLEEELEGSLWKSGWEKRNWAMQSAVGTHPYKEMSSIPDLFRRGEKERELGVILKFPIWTARQMVVQYYSQMESTGGADCRRVSDEASVAMLSCLCLWDTARLHSATRYTRLELEWEVCLGEKDEEIISIKKV